MLEAPPSAPSARAPHCACSPSRCSRRSTTPISRHRLQRRHRPAGAAPGEARRELGRRASCARPRRCGPCARRSVPRSCSSRRASAPPTAPSRTIRSASARRRAPSATARACSSSVGPSATRRIRPRRPQDRRRNRPGERMSRASPIGSSSACSRCAKRSGATAPHFVKCSSTRRLRRSSRRSPASRRDQSVPRVHRVRRAELDRFSHGVAHQGRRGALLPSSSLAELDALAARSGPRRDRPRLDPGSSKLRRGRSVCRRVARRRRHLGRARLGAAHPGDVSSVGRRHRARASVPRALPDEALGALGTRALQRRRARRDGTDPPRRPRPHRPDGARPRRRGRGLGRAVRRSCTTLAALGGHGIRRLAERVGRRRHRALRSTETARTKSGT